MNASLTSYWLVVVVNVDEVLDADVLGFVVICIVYHQVEDLLVYFVCDDLWINLF